MGHGVCSGSWEREVVGAVQGEVVVEELPGWDRRCILKFYLSSFVVGNGNGRPVSCCLTSRVHSKNNNRTVSVSQRKRDMNARHTNPVIM